MSRLAFRIVLLNAVFAVESNYFVYLYLTGQNCPTDGFSPVALPCTCNFAGACHPGTNVVSQAAKADLHNLNGIAPDGLHVLALGPARSVGAICERGIVAVLYDCNALSAVYAATVINGAHLSMPGMSTILS